MCNCDYIVFFSVSLWHNLWEGSWGKIITTSILKKKTLPPPQLAFNKERDGSGAMNWCSLLERLLNNVILRCWLFGGRDHQDDNVYGTDYLWAQHGFSEPFLGSQGLSPLFFMFTHCNSNEPRLSCEFCDGQMKLVDGVRPFLCFRPGYCGPSGCAWPVFLTTAQWAICTQGTL